MIWLIVTLLICSLPAFTWVFYLALMSLKRTRDAVGLSATAEKYGQYLLYVGLSFDFLCNVLPCTVIFLDIPRQWLVTSRLQQYVDGPEGWRKERATWWGKNMLDPFDPSGSHLKYKE